MSPNLKNKDNLENNPMNKDYNYKIVYNLKMNNEKVKKRVITKILKLDENNQYGNGIPNHCLLVALKIVMTVLGKNSTFC